MESQELTEKILKLKTLGGHPRFYELLLEIAELHARKNHDYATNNDPLSNFKQCQAFGLTPFKGILVRLSDKWSRICQLSQKENMVKSESIMDTLQDMAVYSLLAIILYEEESNGKTTVKPTGAGETRKSKTTNS